MLVGLTVLLMPLLIRHADLRFDVEEGDERRKRISSSESPTSKPGDIPEEREPYDCVSNPAPWHHQLTVSS